MVRRSGQQGVPVITLDDEVVVGFDRPRLERILAAGPQQKPVFGAAIADASKLALTQGRLPVFGAYVGKVAPGSPAERAGLRPGDVVTELNLRQVPNAETMEQALANLKRGDTVRLTFTRGDKTLSGEVRV
jgi:serine protease Do